MKFRNEIKHFINFADYLIIKSRLKHIMPMDSFSRKNGEYKIRSLYFDNYNDKALNEKLIGISIREKFRIRFYNDDPSFIRLEKKMKFNNACQKLSTRITKEQCQSIIENKIDFLNESDDVLFKELYLKMKNQVLRPKTIVDYHREAYVFRIGNVRITFDKSVRTGILSKDMFDKDLPTVETLDKKYIILEVKFDEFLPDMIKAVIQTNERRASSISKYALCRIYG